MTSGQPSVLEIACDESGYEGDKLIDTTTDVFAHASVALDVEPAADCMRELRHRIRSPADEYKANHILRQKHREVLRWFLGSIIAGPRGGATSSSLTRSASSCAPSSRVLLWASAPLAVADLLYRHHRGTVDQASWHASWLRRAVMLRTRDRPDGLSSVDVLLDAIDEPSQRRIRRVARRGTRVPRADPAARRGNRVSLDRPMALPVGGSAVSGDHVSG